MRHDNTRWQDPDRNGLYFVLGKQLADPSLSIRAQVVLARDWVKDTHPYAYRHVVRWFHPITYAEEWTDKNIKDEWHIHAMSYMSAIGVVAWYFEGLDAPYEIIDTIWEDEEYDE